MLTTKLLKATIFQSVIKAPKLIDWSLGVAVAVAVSFQFHMILHGGVINFNLADPLALLALLVIGFNMVCSRTLPVWRLTQFNLVLVIISLLLLMGFINGWFDIGITQWALVGRLFGWLMLLGYLSIGYWIVARKGNHGIHQLTIILIATASFVVVFNMAIRLLFHWGFDFGIPLSANFEGFAANRNAFAFQLLTTIALILGYSKTYTRHEVVASKHSKTILSPLLFGIVLVGLIWTGSRAGIGIVLILLLMAWMSRIADRKLLERAVIAAAALWLIVWLAAAAPSIVNALLKGSFEGVLTDGILMQSEFSNEGSNHERLATFTHALEMWKQSPFLGAGLGVFFATSTAWFGHPQVIHNTALWILAEFGLVGIVVYCWVFYMIGHYLLLSRILLSSQRALLVLMIVFILFSLVHEIFYQRIFWLVLGALLAKPFACRTAV
jgi:O-antigen ligase